MKKWTVILLAAALCAFPITALSACSEEEPKVALPEVTEPDNPEIPPTMPEEGPFVSENEAPMPEEDPPETPATEPPKPIPTTATYVRVKANGLNVRTGAGTTFLSLGTVEKDTLLQLAGKNGNWYETRYRGRTAYVSAEGKYTELCELPLGAERAEEVIAAGLKLLGTPYVYGAVRLHDGRGNKLRNFTAEKFDCSSLMQYIFYEGAGVLLDVTTRTQIKQGTHIDKTEIKRGDLLFFTNASRKDLSGIERVGHVALYLGDNYILHTASDYAKIEQISSLRWSYFIEARRV